MRTLILLIILSFLQTLALGQTRTIRGIIYDKQTNAHIEGVKITPDFFEDSTTSNTTGRFKKHLPTGYREIITFKHPDFYPHEEKIKAGFSTRHLLVYMIPRTIHLDTLFYLSDQKNRKVLLKIIDDYGGDPIDNAEISLENDDIIAYTDFNGSAEPVIPRKTKNLIVSHNDFYSKILTSKLFDNWNRQGSRVKLKRINLRQIDTLWALKKNIVSLSPLELINGAVALRYERFLRIRHSIGLHASFYLFGRILNTPFIDYNYSRFSGFKFAPSYRFYIWRNKHNGGFFEIKSIIGYFDFYKLEYYYSYRQYKTTIKDKFLLAGGAAALGFKFVPHEGPIVLNISIGFQYFPINFKPSITDSDGRTYYPDVTWWYWGGPGSYVDIKFTIGGIF